MSGVSVGETGRLGRTLLLEAGMTGRLSCGSGAWTEKQIRTSGLTRGFSL